MKDLLITHIDLDGISPVILLNLTGRKFDYKMFELHEVDEVFKTLFASDLSVYENIYITDLTLPTYVYDYFNEHQLNVKVFDHHETHMYANVYDYAQIAISLNNRLTCGTELFYNYLKELYPIIDTNVVKEYVDLVREADTFTFTSDLSRHINALKETYGKLDFIKSITKRLKKNKEHFELTTFEKRFVKLKKEELQRYLQYKASLMKTYVINNHKCGVVFAENNKSELGNYLSTKHPELDLIILIDAASRISYRTTKDDVSVAEFATTYGGGGHQKASGSNFTDSDRDMIIKNYFKDAHAINEEDLNT